MSSSVVMEKPVAATYPETGTVQVSAMTSASVAEAWNALTDPQVVSRWFGDLSDSLAPGRRVRLSFGDGDFFIIDSITLAPTSRLDYSWRFLGTGTESAITWELKSSPAGTLVTVTDREAFRSPAGVDEMVEGWTDFLTRLQCFLATGEVTRYDWRRDFDGGIDLPVSLDKSLVLFRQQQSWLPFDLVAGRSSSALTETTLRVMSVDWESPSDVRFSLRAGNWDAPTMGELRLSAKGSRSSLSVCHTGWNEISKDPGFCMCERRRFSELWINSLNAASQLLTKTL